MTKAKFNLLIAITSLFFIGCNSIKNTSVLVGAERIKKFNDGLSKKFKKTSCFNKEINYEFINILIVSRDDLLNKEPTESQFVEEINSIIKTTQNFDFFSTYIVDNKQEIASSDLTYNIYCNFNNLDQDLINYYVENKPDSFIVFYNYNLSYIFSIENKKVYVIEREPGSGLARYSYKEFMQKGLF